MAKRFLQCIFKKVNMCNDDGFVFDEVLKWLEPNRQGLVDAVKVRQDFDSCVEAHRDKTDKCLNTIEVFECFTAKYDAAITKVI